MKYITLLLLVLLPGCATKLTVTSGECSADFSQPWYGSATSIKADACGAEWSTTDVDSNAQSIQSVVEAFK